MGRCEVGLAGPAGLRVSQAWAGGQYGFMALPRIGHEVIVSFLDGDPDQPIITGRTYHATNTPPYALPEHKTRTTLKTKTHKGEGSNELRFEDEADYSLTVGGCHHSKQGKNQLVEAGAEIHHTAGMKIVIEAGAEVTLKGGGSFVKLDPSGVTISGPVVRMNSGGGPGSGGVVAPKGPDLPANFTN